MYSTLKKKGHSPIAGHVKSSTPAYNADYMANARFKDKTPRTGESKPIDVQSFGMNIVAQYRSYF